VGRGNKKPTAQGRGGQSEVECGQEEEAMNAGTNTGSNNSNESSCYFGIQVEINV
jgi:hypothetical protein